MTCPRCLSDVTTPGPCPGCQFDVPAEWFTSTVLSVAFTGARTAGKTVLIAVLMRQFEQFLKTRHRAILSPLGGTAEHFEEVYVNPLYRDGEAPSATPPSDVFPMFWSFSVRGRDICLTIIDAAGEELQALSPQDKKFAFLGAVDEIVCILDPLKIPKVAHLLDGVMRAPLDSGDDLDVLRRVLQTRSTHYRGGMQYVALTLTKFDAFHKLSEVGDSMWQQIVRRPGAAMRRDPSAQNPWFDVQDQALLHSELLSLLHYIDAELPITLLDQSRVPYGVYGVSALGMEPNDTRIASVGIVPFRVLDLLKAALALKLGVDQ